MKGAPRSTASRAWGKKMKRFPDWPTRLSAFFEERKERPFVWGEHDCALFAADAVLVMTGVDLAGTLREKKYSDALGVRAVLRQIEATSVPELMDWIAELHGLREIPVPFAQRGDLAMLNHEALQALGIVSLDGLDVISPGKDRLVANPTRYATRAWRI